MKRTRHSSPKHGDSCALTAHRFKPLRSQWEFDECGDSPRLDDCSSSYSACCICASVCLPSEKLFCTVGHLQAHVRCMRALLACPVLPPLECSNDKCPEFSCWSMNSIGFNKIVPELLLAAAEPSAVLRICSALLKQRRSFSAEPLSVIVLPDNFVEAAALLQVGERPWPSFPFMSALEAALYGCEVLLQPCHDARMRLFFKGGLLDSAEVFRVGEFVLPPIKCASLGCKSCCHFKDFFNLGWLVHARAYALEEGAGLICTCAAHAFSSLPATFARLAVPPPPRANVDFPTVDLFDCVQDLSEGRCGVCLTSSSTANDALMLCAGCGVACHQSCCDEHQVPAGNWYCQVCVSGLQRERHRCCVCPVAFGVLQYAAPPELFIHTSCASALLGARPSPSKPFLVHAAATVHSNAQNCPCCGCGSRIGFKVSCRGRGCMLSAHPICALAQGWLQQPHSKWLCAVHNENPRVPRDSLFEFKVGGVDGAGRILMSMSEITNSCDSHVHFSSDPSSFGSSSTATGAAAATTTAAATCITAAATTHDHDIQLQADSFDHFGSQGTFAPVSWSAVGALPYRAPSVSFPTSFSLLDAIYKLVQFPPSDVLKFDLFVQKPISSTAAAASSSASSSHLVDSADSPWTIEEDSQLLRAVQDIGSSSWHKVAQVLSSGRSKKQCRKRWWQLVHRPQPGQTSGPIDDAISPPASRSFDKPFAFDSSAPSGSLKQTTWLSQINRSPSFFSRNSRVYTCYLTPVQRFAVVVLAMIAQRQLQSSGSVTQIAWDCVIDAFNAIMDALSCCIDLSSAQLDNGYVARSSLSGAFAVLSWLHCRACTGGGGSSRFVVVIGKTFFNSGTAAPTAAKMLLFKSAFLSSEFIRNPIPVVTVTLDCIHETVINKSDAIVVLHGDRCGVADAEACIRRAVPPEYNQPLSHILPVVGLSDVLGLNACSQSVSVHQFSAVTSCLLAAALRGVHVFEVPSFLSRPKSVQDAVLTAASASARLVELMVQQFRDVHFHSSFELEENSTFDEPDDLADADCSWSRRGVLINDQTPAAAACRLCFCFATNGSLPLTSSAAETRSIVFKSIKAALVAWMCSADSLAGWLLKASEVDLFWKRASQHAVSMMRHPGLQADMSLCRFGDQLRHLDHVTIETLGVFFAVDEDASASVSQSNSASAFSVGVGARVARSFWDAATGRHRCIWVTETFHSHTGPLFCCYGRSASHEMFVGASAADAWTLARNKVLLSRKDGSSLIDMTCNVGQWLGYLDPRILAEARFIIFSNRLYRCSTSKSFYVRSPGFVFTPIHPIDSLGSIEASTPFRSHDRVMFPAATRRGVVLINLNERGYIDLKVIGNHSTRRLPPLPVALEDGLVIECPGYYSVEYAAAGGSISISNGWAPLVNFKSVRSIQQNGSNLGVFVNSIAIENRSLVYKIVAKCGFHDDVFIGSSEVDAFSSLIAHRPYSFISRTVKSASVWFGSSSALMITTRESAARAADAAAASILAGKKPESAAYVEYFPCEELSQQSQLNHFKATQGINVNLSGIKFKAMNHCRGRQVDCDAVTLALAKGSFAVIQHSHCSHLPSRRVIRRGPSMLIPNSSVLLQLDCLNSSPAFRLTVHETPPVVYVAETAAAVLAAYFQCVAKIRSCAVSELMSGTEHWTGETAGSLGSSAQHRNSKHIVFQAADTIDVDASFLYKLPNEGVCSAQGDIQVTVLSFGMWRLTSTHASSSNFPLPGFCSVTIDREGRAYVYTCHDDDAHWMHALENIDGAIVLTFFARSFEGLQHIVRESGIELPSDDLFGYERARQKLLLPLASLVPSESSNISDLDFYSSAEGDLDFEMALFDIQDETSRIPLASEQHTSLNCSYPHIGEVFDVCAPVCSSTFQIQSAGVILKGKELVFVSGLPISHGFHSTGSFIFDNGNTIAFECTTVYTSSHGNALIKLSLASEGVVLRFTEKSFHHNLLFAYFGISTKTSSLSGIGGQLMVKLVGLSQVFSHRRVLGALELMMPPYVVSVIKSVPSALDPPSIVVDLDVYLSAPHHCSGVCIERWGTARQDLIMDGLVVPLGFSSSRSLCDGRLVRCEVEADTTADPSPGFGSVIFSVCEVCSDGGSKDKVSARSPQQAWLTFLGLSFDVGLERVLERFGCSRCNGMVLFGLGVSSVQSLIHFICKSSVWQQQAGSSENGFTEEEERTEKFVSPFDACEKLQSRRFSAAISRHTQTFLTWLESKRPPPPLKQCVLGDLAPSQQIEHQDAAEMWKKIIERDYGDYRDMVHREFT